VVRLTSTCCFAVRANSQSLGGWAIDSSLGMNDNNGRKEYRKTHWSAFGGGSSGVLNLVFSVSCGSHERRNDLYYLDARINSEARQWKAAR
jgi:hypothetical protein